MDHVHVTGFDSTLRVERSAECNTSVAGGLAALIVSPDHIVLCQLEVGEEVHDVVYASAERHVFHGHHTARSSEIVECGIVVVVHTTIIIKSSVDPGHTTTTPEAPAATSPSVKAATSLVETSAPSKTAPTCIKAAPTRIKAASIGVKATPIRVKTASVVETTSVKAPSVESPTTSESAAEPSATSLHGIEEWWLLLGNITVHIWLLGSFQSFFNYTARN